MKKQEKEKQEEEKEEKKEIIKERMIMEKSSDIIYSLEPKFLFGMTQGLSNNCFFLNDNNIIYNAAGVLVIHNISSNIQKFLYLKDPQKIITTMELNNAKYDNRK